MTIEITDRLIQVGRILDIEVIDHLVISVTSYLSFADTGLMHELEQSTKWVPQYRITAQIKKEEKKIREQAVKEAEEKAEKQKSIEMAKVLKRKGVDIEIIIEATGLTREEIEKIKVR